MLAAGSVAMTSDIDDLEQALQKNLKLRSELNVNLAQLCLPSRLSSDRVFPCF